MNKYRGQVPSPALGDGTYLCFTWNGIAEIETLVGRRDWWGPVMEALDGYSATIMTGLVSIGLHNADGVRVAAGKKYSLPDDVTPQEVIVLLLDAIYMSVHRKTFAEFTEEQIKRQQDLLVQPESEDKNPPKALMESFPQ